MLSRFPVYSVVLDPIREQACSGSMDGTVRIWSLNTGQLIHNLSGHTSLVGLLGLSPSHLVSAAADSSLRVWDPDTGELKHTLQAHTGAITCFQHDEFKVLSGSDGTLKMWDIRDGTFVRDLLTGINGVWQVVFEGRWCVAASNRTDTTVLDVWDFGREEGDDEWIGEPAKGLYDDSTDEEDEEDEHDQADVDAMDQDLEVVASEAEMADDDLDIGDSDRELRAPAPEDWDYDTPIRKGKDPRRPARQLWDHSSNGEGSSRSILTQEEIVLGDIIPEEPELIPRFPSARSLPLSEETPVRPRIRGRKRQ